MDKETLIDLFKFTLGFNIGSCVGELKKLGVTDEEIRDLIHIGTESAIISVNSQSESN